jgi:hypothetical protein
MNTHLSAQEFVDAVEGMLAADRQDHLAACEACGRAVTELREVTSEARAALTVPEPSPLFWDHFSRRVRAATDTEIVPIVAPRWWESAWGPMAAISSVVSAVALVALVYTSRTAQPDATAVASAVAIAAAEPMIDEGSLSLIAQIAADQSDEDLQAARPTMGATAAVIDELTPAQQTEFLRLIKAEMGNPE